MHQPESTDDDGSSPRSRRFASRYLALDQPGRALDQLNQWLRVHPNEIRRGAALNSRCWLRMRLDTELAAALDDCDDAVDSDPKNPSYLNSRGWVHLRLGRYKEALADFDRSLRLQPQGGGSLYGRGMTKARQGDAGQGEADPVRRAKGTA